MAGRESDAGDSDMDDQIVPQLYHLLSLLVPFYYIPSTPTQATPSYSSFLQHKWSLAVTSLLRIPSVTISKPASITNYNEIYIMLLLIESPVY